MPFKDPEKRKAAQRDSKQRSRALIESGDQAESKAESPGCVICSDDGSGKCFFCGKPITTSEALGSDREGLGHSPERSNPAPQGAISFTDRHSTAYQVAKRSRELLSGQEFVLWKCTRLNNEIVCIIRDDLVKKYPENFPVFTVDEISAMHKGNMSLEQWQFCVDTKKVCGKVLVEA